MCLRACVNSACIVYGMLCLCSALSWHGLVLWFLKGQFAYVLTRQSSLHQCILSVYADMPMLTINSL